MNRSILARLFGIALLVLACTSELGAQTSTSPTSKQEVASNELVNEVRQLRIALQQLSVNAYRGQVMVERLRLQQEQVNRLSQELNAARNHLADLRSEQITIKAKFEEAEKQREAGVAGESQTSRYKEILESLKRTEERLVEQDGQISSQLEEERSSLNDLNKRLDALEREMVIKGQVLETQKPEKH